MKDFAPFPSVYPEQTNRPPPLEELGAGSWIFVLPTWVRF